jgi:hypothetical protein
MGVADAPGVALARVDGVGVGVVLAPGVGVDAAPPHAATRRAAVASAATTAVAERDRWPGRRWKVELMPRILARGARMAVS